MSETVSIEQINELKAQGRRIEEAVTGDPALGPFALLPGTWANEPTLPGRGWNMIALPFAPQNGSLSPTFRLLLNQYNEILNFFLVDKAEPDRRRGLSGEWPRGRASAGNTPRAGAVPQHARPG